MDQARGVAEEISGIALECNITSETQAEAAIGWSREAHGAGELSHHAIRVMAIAPGIFDIPTAVGLRQDYIGEMTQAIAFPEHFGQPVEFARMVETILTTTLLNGATVRIDGGSRMT